MYRKITRNIVEEHYEYPSYEEYNTIRSMLPNNELFDQNDITNQIRSYTNEFANYMNQLIDTMKSPDVSLSMAFDNFFNNGFIDRLGNLTKPFFNAELGETINLNFRSIVLDTINAIRLAKSGQDITFYENKLRTYHNMLTQTMAMYNNHWTISLLASSLRSFVDGIISKINARADDNDQLSSTLSQVMLDDLTTFGTDFANGLIRKFPERFYTSTP
jgi:hypothetical protein